MKISTSKLKFGDYCHLMVYTFNAFHCFCFQKLNVKQFPSFESWSWFLRRLVITRFALYKDNNRHY